MKIDNDKQNPTIVKVKNFLRLEQGWHFGEGNPPTIECTKKASRIVERAIMLLFGVDVFPGIDGEIMVTIYYKNHYLEFIVETDETVTFIHEQDDIEIDSKENLHFSSALKKLNDFGEVIWNMSELSTLSTMIPEKKNLKVSPLGTLQTEAFRLFQTSASQPWEITLVNTSINTIPKSLRCLQSIGYFDWENCQNNATLNNIRALPEMSAMAT